MNSTSYLEIVSWESKAKKISFSAILGLLQVSMTRKVKRSMSLLEKKVQEKLSWNICKYISYYFIDFYTILFD